MQRIRIMIRVFLLVMATLLSLQTDVFAEQLNSVKDCIEQPDKCSEEQINPQDTDGGKTETSSKVGITIWDFVKMILATLFVVALLYFLLKFINKKSHGYKNSQLVQNIGGTSLGANKSVQIITVQNRVFILGVGDNIELLKEIEDEEEARQIITEYNNKMEQLAGPSDIITKIIKMLQKNKTIENEKDKHSFSSTLSKQLEDISKSRKRLYDEIQKKGPDDK